MGIPGLLLALIFKLTVVEPRTLMRDAQPMRRALPSLRAVLLMLWGQRSSRNLCIGLVLFYTVSYGMWQWFSAFMIRSHGASTGELGVWLGLIFSIGGVAGTLLGGYVANRWFTNDERGQMRMSAVAVAAAVPCFVVFLMVPGKHQALGALLPLIVVFSFFVAPTFAIMQRLVPPEMRATVMATIMLLANLIGMGIGPQLVGILSDTLMPTLGVESLRYAMVLASFTAFGASWYLWKVARTVTADLLPAG
jgi:MFS family permease